VLDRSRRPVQVAPGVARDSERKLDDARLKLRARPPPPARMLARVVADDEFVAMVGRANGFRTISDVACAGTGPASAHGRAEPLEGTECPREHPSATHLEDAAEPSSGSEGPRERGRRGAEHTTAHFRAIAEGLAGGLRRVGRVARAQRAGPIRSGRQCCEPWDLLAVCWRARLLRRLSIA
jgi:hypothetical protein